MSLPKIIKMGAIAAAVIGSGVASAQDFITIGTRFGYWCLLPYGRRYL